MIALNTRDPERLRVQAITVLGGINPDQSCAVLMESLAPRQPLAVQIAAAQALAETRSAKLPDLLLPRMREFEPSVSAAAVQTLLSRVEWAKALLQAIGQNNRAAGITPALIEPGDRAPLLKHHDTEIAKLARAIFDRSTSSSRTQVIADYLAAPRSKGDTSRGATVFDRECKTCHKVGERGFALGPDLTGSPSGDATALLANILDPNANVLPNYVQYLVIDQNGRTYSGIITSETATSLTLRRGEGVQDTILRAQIAEMKSTGLSLMPEGFEKRISRPEMADLVAFLQAAHHDGEGGEASPTAAQSRPLDIGTLPGLIEPDK